MKTMKTMALQLKVLYSIRKDTRLDGFWFRVKRSKR